MIILKEFTREKIDANTVHPSLKYRYFDGHGSYEKSG
jgi:hypothetical protein